MTEEHADVGLAAEQSHLELARRCIEQMRRSAEHLGDYGVDALASESLGRLRSERLAHLTDDTGAPAFFGRTDRDPDPGDPGGIRRHPQGEVFHIGRRHIRNELGDPVVIDWRAPIARAFYQATPADRQGVRLRRRFGFRIEPTAKAAVLTSYEDEHLDAGENLGLASHLLREEIERPRVGPMRDIVATIQPDQDQLVRADLNTSICVQGGPGTGKTAVGLHRAAFLLYSYPERLRRSGVLVIGPNAAFLRYIGQVLPSLGESGITQTTVTEMVAAEKPTAARRATDAAPHDGRRTDGAVPRDESTAVAVLKGDARMADVLRRAVLSHVAKPSGDVVPIVGTRRFRIPVERARRYVDDTRRSLTSGELRWDSARQRLMMLLAQDVRRRREDAGGAPSDTETNKVARSAEVKAFADEVWPVLDPRSVLVRLFTDAPFAQRCAAGALTPDEIAALAWSTAPPSTKAARFSEADRVLLDELGGLIWGVDQYVHVVVDEAQDLSAMQCRAIGRRCPTGSVTVLGDLAQATAPWATGSWESTLAHLGRPEAEIRPLTVGYRSPAEVLRSANRLLPFIAPGIPAATSMRTGEDDLTFTADLIAAVRRCLVPEGSVAVIGIDAAVPELRSALAAAGIRAEDLGGGPNPENPAGDSADQPPSRVTVLAASAAKGLEFDSVVLVEPADIVAGEATRQAGLRRLYIAWTRAVSRLVVVHQLPLPAELCEA